MRLVRSIGRFCSIVFFNIVTALMCLAAAVVVLVLVREKEGAQIAGLLLLMGVVSLFAGHVMDQMGQTEECY